MPIFDFDAIPEDDGSLYRLVPEAWCYAKIADGKEKLIHDKDTGALKGAMWSLTYHCYEDGNEKPFAVEDPVFLYGGGLARLKALLKALDMPHHGKVEVDIQQVIGGELAMDVCQKFDSFRQAMRMRANGFNPWRHIGDLGQLQKEDQRINQKLDGSYKAQEAHRSGAPPKAVHRPQQSDVIQIDDDDVPF